VKTGAEVGPNCGLHGIRFIYYEKLLKMGLEVMRGV
jgi:hypothetical protein